jgi:large subunit ribosomal protein L22
MTSVKKMKNPEVALYSDGSAVAKLKVLRTATSKLSAVAGLIRKMPVAEALVQLTFCKRRISGAVKSCLQSAIANAENNHFMDVDNLYVHEVLVGKSMVMKRFRPRARGRAASILKPFSHLTIILKEQEGRL